MFPGEPAFTTTLTNGTSIAQGVFIEMFLTAELVFTVLMLAAEKSKATFIAPGKRFSRRSLTSMVLDAFMCKNIKEGAEKERTFFLEKTAADAEYSDSGHRACFICGRTCRYVDYWSSARLVIITNFRVGVYFTGGSLNPTRSFGPCVATANFPGYHWVYWLGPLLGALISGGYYRFVKFNNYEEANPGQDDSHNPQDDPQCKHE